MGIIDSWAENFFKRHGETWVPIKVMRSDNKEGIEKISEFHDNCRKGCHPVMAYINKESLFFQDYEKILKDIKDKKIIYREKTTKKPLTFLVCGNSILIEDSEQIFVKYHTQLLGKSFAERFNKLYSN